MPSKGRGDVSAPDVVIGSPPCSQGFPCRNHAELMWKQPPVIRVFETNAGQKRLKLPPGVYAARIVASPDHFYIHECRIKRTRLVFLKHVVDDQDRAAGLKRLESIGKDLV